MSQKLMLVRIWHHLSNRRKRQLGFVFCLMLMSGLSEAVTLASIIPFLSVLSDPNRLWDIHFLQLFFSSFGFKQPSQLVLPITILFSFTALVTSSIRLVNLWINNRMSAAIGSDLSCESFRKTILQKYSFHLEKNSSELITSTIYKTSNTVAAICSYLQFATSLIISISIVIVLLFLNLELALLLILIFSVSYGLIIVNSRRQLLINSKIVATEEKNRVKALQEALGAIRQVILDELHDFYMSIYRKSDRSLRLKEAQSWFIGSSPRYVLEALGLLTMSLLAFLITLQQENSANVIPILGTIAFGAQRLLPSMQMLFAQWAQIKSQKASIEHVLEILDFKIDIDRSCNGKINLPLMPKIIQFKDVYFSYKNNTNVLKNINLDIYQGERIGIIGTTGSGKSTLLDILMGLLKPTKGNIFVDKLDINDPSVLPRWRASISHVPQNIFLSDNSFAENIAFGIPLQEIDMNRVKSVARQAKISDMIEKRPSGYFCYVGERGVRLSGGQRQRIAIARALYKKANILILDEATSALDNDTEKGIMKSINNLSKQLTIIIIAHRITTIRNCDRVIQLENGEKTAEGSPEELFDN